ncbi:hypothetical protein [Xanthomonas sp. WHRI 7945]|nr:hypothetical protein [Xanthomonas campestris pv. campestris]
MDLGRLTADVQVVSDFPYAQQLAKPVRFDAVVLEPSADIGQGEVLRAGRHMTQVAMSSEHPQAVVAAPEADGSYDIVVHIVVDPVSIEAKGDPGHAFSRQGAVLRRSNDRARLYDQAAGEKQGVFVVHDGSPYPKGRIFGFFQRRARERLPCACPTPDQPRVPVTFVNLSP